MNSSKDLLSKVLIFATGAAIGSVVAWYLTKKKYEPDDYWCYEEETAQIEPVISSDSKAEKDKAQDMVQYNKYIKAYATTAETENKVEVNEKEVNKDVERPYQISVDEFSELEDYETVSLYYYEDHVLTDELGNPVNADDIDATIGLDNLKQFDDDPEWDSCYIRNDVTKTDYEILRDMGCYYPVTKEDN